MEIRNQEKLDLKMAYYKGTWTLISYLFLLNCNSIY